MSICTKLVKVLPELVSQSVPLPNFCRVLVVAPPEMRPVMTTLLL